MRILHLNLERGWRGGERQTLFTLAGLRAAGHDAVLLARTGSALAARARAAGVPVFECKGTPAMVRTLLANRRKFDVMHAQTAQAMSVLAALRPLLRAAIVFTRRTAFDAGTASVARHRWKWSRADALVAISAAAAQAPRALGLSVEVIPSAVEAMRADPDRVRALREQYGLDGRVVLLTAAALSPEKDPQTLIAAVDILRRTHPDVLCLHCGADGSAGQDARLLIDSLGLHDHYVLAGFHEHIADALAVANVYVSSSRYEALGTSVLDACLAGLPVVASDAGGHREILDPDRGLLAPVGNAPTMARRIAWVLQNPGPARAMAMRAREAVAREYSVPAMVGRYESLYLGLRGR